MAGPLGAMIPGGRPRHKAIRESKKDDPPGGTTGRVVYDTGVDEAPVSDAGSGIPSVDHQ